MDLRRLLLPSLGARPVEPGLHHYRIELPDRHSRVHLRVEPDGDGVMLVDATIAVRLNASAMAIARAILEGKTLDETRRILRRAFRGASADQVAEDYGKIRQILYPDTHQEDACPWIELASQDDEPFSMKVSA